MCLAACLRMKRLIRRAITCGLGVLGIAAACGAGACSANGNQCVDIDVSTYDTSCNADSDCIIVNAGHICSGYTCLCGNATINVDGQARYNAAMSSLTPGGPGCGCPAFGQARCVQSTCTYCPTSIGSEPAPAGCPDAGGGG